MLARAFTCAAVVAIVATTGCAATQKPSLSTRTVCVKRTQPANVAIGVSGDHLVLGAKTLWAIPSDGPMDQPRAFALSSGDLVVAFRQADAIWVGLLDPRAEAIGELHRVGGQGHWLGAPAVRVDGDDVLLAWRDGDDVKLATWRTSSAPAAPQSMDDVSVARFCDRATL
jgi:hypothetical protein